MMVTEPAGAVRRLLTVPLLLLAASLAGGCGDHAASDVHAAAPGQTGAGAAGSAAPATAATAGGGTAPGAAPPAAKGNKPMSDTDLVKQHVAQELGIAPADIAVKVEDDVAVPGITVFAATSDSAKLGRHAARYGIVDGGTIYTETEAMSRVARAWKYGPKRTVSAADFALVMGWLNDARHGSKAMTSAYNLNVYKSIAGPKQAAAAALPTETTVDGHPAVRYCLTSSARGAPLTVVTAVVRPDFTVEIQKQPISSD